MSSIQPLQYKVNIEIDLASMFEINPDYNKNKVGSKEYKDRELNIKTIRLFCNVLSELFKRENNFQFSHNLIFNKDTIVMHNINNNNNVNLGKIANSFINGTAIIIHQYGYNQRKDTIRFISEKLYITNGHPTNKNIYILIDDRKNEFTYNDSDLSACKLSTANVDNDGVVATVKSWLNTCFEYREEIVEEIINNIFTTNDEV